MIKSEKGNGMKRTVLAVVGVVSVWHRGRRWFLLFHFLPPFTSEMSESWKSSSEFNFKPPESPWQQDREA